MCEGPFAGNCKRAFYVIGNSAGIPYYIKRHCVPMIIFYSGSKPMKKLREKEMHLEFIINRKMSKLAGDKTRGEYDNRAN